VDDGEEVSRRHGPAHSRCQNKTQASHWYRMAPGNGQVVTHQWQVGNPAQNPCSTIWRPQDTCITFRIVTTGAISPRLNPYTITKDIAQCRLASRSQL